MFQSSGDVNVKVKGAKVHEEMEFRESFSLTEKDLSAFGEQTVNLVCYRGNISKPEWVDRDACKSLMFFATRYRLIWTITAAYATLCTITVDLSRAAKDLSPKKKFFGKNIYQLDYDVIIFFGLTELKAELGWKTKVSSQPYILLVVYLIYFPER